MKIFWLLTILFFYTPALGEESFRIAMNTPVNATKMTFSPDKNVKIALSGIDIPMKPLRLVRPITGYAIGKDSLGSTKIETFSGFPWDLRSIMLVMHEAFTAKNEWINFLDKKMVSKTGRTIQWSDGDAYTLSAFVTTIHPDFTYAGDPQTRVTSGLLLTARFR